MRELSEIQVPDSKRKRTSGRESASSLSTPSSRRTIDLSSCVECKRRKQKCDKREPCSQCVNRKVPHLCQPIADGVVRSDPIVEMNARLTRIEAFMSRMSTALSPNEDPASHYNDLIDSSFATHSISLRDKPVKVGWSVESARSIALDQTRNHSHLHELLHVLELSGFGKTDLEQLLSKVPGRRIADELVDFYFAHIDWLHFKIHEPDFRRQYESLFAALNENPTNPTIDANLLRWLPLFFTVLCIAVFESPSDILASEHKPSWLGRFYACSQTSVDYVRSLRTISVDFLLGSILCSSFMLMAGRSTAGTIPLTYAFRLGLHRDPTVLNMSDNREIELRRRAWAQLYHLDRMVALMVGRPPIISDSHTDTSAPANLDDEELEEDFDMEGHLLFLPTKWTYIIVRHHLAEILGRIAQYTFALKPGSYETVLVLDQELLSWREALPPFLSIADENTMWDEKHQYLSAQRFMLACEWHYARVTLHRPYLLRQDSAEEKYSYSRSAAAESAEADLRYRRNFMMDKSDVTSRGGYRMTDSLMVIAVCIRLEKSPESAERLRKLLDMIAGKEPDHMGRRSKPLGMEELSLAERLANRSSGSSDGAEIDGTVLGLQGPEAEGAKCANGRSGPQEEQERAGGSSSLLAGTAPTLAQWAATFVDPVNEAAFDSLDLLGTMPSQSSPTTDFLANLFCPTGPSLPYGQASTSSFDIDNGYTSIAFQDNYMVHNGLMTALPPFVEGTGLSLESDDSHIEQLLQSLMAGHQAA